MLIAAARVDCDPCCTRRPYRPVHLDVCASWGRNNREGPNLRVRTGNNENDFNGLGVRGVETQFSWNLQCVNLQCVNEIEFVFWQRVNESLFASISLEIVDSLFSSPLLVDGSRIGKG